MKYLALKNGKIRTGDHGVKSDAQPAHLIALFLTAGDEQLGKMQRSVPNESVSLAVGH